MATFGNKAERIVKIANRLGLESVCNMNRNEKVDFPMMFGEEAINTSTLENPLTASVKSYVYVRLPKDANKSEESHKNYEVMAYELCKAAKPDYLIGAKDGVVKVLMWADSL